MKYRTRYKTGEKSLTPKQIEKLIAALDSYRDETLIKLELALGCRRSDIVRIEWTHTNEESKSITYHEQKKGDRLHTAFVSDTIIQMLKRYRNLSQGKYLFPAIKRDNSKGHLSDRTAYDIFNRAMKRAGIIQKNQCWPFHALRATCIKKCQSVGWSAEQTAAHVNDSVRVIQEHYTTPSLFERAKVAEENPII